MSRWGMPEENWQAMERRAAGGASVVCTGECFVDDEFSCRENDPPRRFVDLQGDEMRIAKQYVNAIKKHGALAMVELNHCGQSKVGASCKNKTAIGPDAWEQEDGISNVAMDLPMMEHVADNFAQCAWFMKQAGFDGAVVLCGHGWLIHQFLSPRTNHRKDEFGGSIENRSRFPLMILKRIRERCGADFIIEPRVSGDEGMEGGLGVEEVAQFCKMAVDMGVADIIQVSQGIYRSPVFSREFPTLFHESACNRHNAKYIRDVCNCPVSLVGAINSPDLIEELLEEGYCDIALMGRQHFADVELPKKVMMGEADEVRHCVRCGRCFEGPHEDWAEVDEGGTHTKNKTPPICTVNPNLNREHYAQDSLVPTGSRKKVLVIGGGPGGMTAAIAAADRGHSVTLIEKTDSLGGLLKFADYDIHKEDLRFYKDQLMRRMERRDVTVLLETEFDKEILQKIAPEHIICAVGSSPFVPPVPGIENVLHALEVYWRPEIIGKRVIMVGGGLVGCETAMHLADTGHDVTIIEMADELARESKGTAELHRTMLLDLIEKKCHAYTSLKCIEMSPTAVTTEDLQGRIRCFEADTVVYAMGLRPNTAVVDRCRELASGIPFDAVGDCVKAQAVAYAGFDAVSAAYRI